MQALEERLLFLLLLLRQPRLRVIYVTGRPVPRASSTTTWRCCPASSRDRRVAACTWSRRTTAQRAPLAEKLLERPRVLAEIRALIPDPARCHLVPYTTTTAERDLALTLGIPLYGADPIGCCRSAPRPAAGGSSPRPACRTRSATRTCTTTSARDRRAGAHARRRARRRPRPSSSSTTASPGAATRWSTCATCRRLARPSEGAALRASRRGDGVRARTTSCSRPTSPSFARGGGIVEERVIGVELRSPSVQLRVTPLGEVELLSTHDQLLGGPSGQTLPRLPVPGRLRLRARDQRARRRRSARGSRGRRARPLRRRLRRRARRATAPGRRTRSSSTCARAERRTRSSRCSS